MWKSYIDIAYILAPIETVTPQHAPEMRRREEYEWIAGNSS